MNTSQSLKGFPFVLAVFAVSLGTFLIALDQFIANVSIPSISGELGVSQEQGAWVITSFTVANAIMVPLTGWLTKRIGRVRLFALSAVLFSVMSFFCGTSISLTMLIVFRVLQGIVSGALIPLSQSLLMVIFPQEKKGLAIGLWGFVVMVGPVMGPVLGGWITDNYGWGWIFYINVPIGIFAGVVVSVLLSQIESKKEKIPLDTLGLIFFMCGISSLQILLDKGNQLDWWGSPVIIILTIVTIVSLSFFIVWERFHKNPVVDLSFFKSWNFTIGSIAISLSLMFIFGGFIVEPLWVQAQLGYTPEWAGYTLAPIGVFAVVFFPLIGLILHIIDLRIWIIVSFILFSMTFFWYSALPEHPPYWAIATPHLVQGVALALLYVPLTHLAVAAVPEEKLPSATGLFTFIRILFLSFGVSLSVTFWNRRESFYQSRYVESAIPSNPAFGPYYETLSQLGIQGDQANGVVYNIVNNQAYTMSFLDLSYLGGWIFVFLILLAFFFRPPKKEEKKAHIPHH